MVGWLAGWLVGFQDVFCFGRPTEGAAERTDAGAVADLFAAPGATRDVARCDHQGEAIGDLAVSDRQGSGEFESDGCGFTRHQVADPQGESAGTFFFGDGCALTRSDGAVVGLARLSALLQVALDGAAAHLHDKARGGGAIGQGKNVGRFDGHVQRVDEGLAHGGVGEGANDASGDVQGLQRQVSL